MGRKLKKRKRRFQEMMEAFIEKYGTSPQEWIDQWTKDGYPDTSFHTFTSMEARASGAKYDAQK